MNGDGYADFAIGAPRADADAYKSGGAYIVHGPILPGQHEAHRAAAATFSGATDDLRLGSSLAMGGDIDGDGIGDLVIGAQRHSIRGFQSGSVYVFLGPFSGHHTSDEAVAVMRGTDNSRTAMRGALEFVGDLDQDGRDDIALGSPMAYVNGAQTGATYMLYGSTLFP
jgi:hypothetical protein